MKKTWDILGPYPAKYDYDTNRSQKPKLLNKLETTKEVSSNRTLKSSSNLFTQFSPKGRPTYCIKPVYSSLTSVTIDNSNSKLKAKNEKKFVSSNEKPSKYDK